MLNIYRWRQIKQNEIIHLVVGIGTFIIFTHCGLLPGYLMQPSDGARAVYPDYHWIARELKSGNFPTWLPYYYGGLPFPCYGGGVVDINIIPFFLFFPDKAATVMMLSQMFVLFVVIFLWLRMFDFSEGASFMVTGLVIWSGPVMFWYGYGFPYNAYIYAVLSMIFVEIYHRRSNAWCLFLLSSTVALSALSLSIQHQLNVPIAILITALAHIIIEKQIKPFLLTLLFLGLGYFMATSHMLSLFHSLSEVGRGGYNYGETFHFSPLRLFLAIWSGETGATIGYPAFYFFIPPLLVAGFIVFFIKKCGEKYVRTFIFTGLAIFALFIAPMYIIPLILPAYRIADPYRQWFIIIIVFAVASASAIDIVWKDINKQEAMPRRYWIGSIIMALLLLLFKGLENYYLKLQILSSAKSIWFFLLPAATLPFLFLIRKVWIRSIVVIILFGCSYYFIGYQARTLYVQGFAKNPNGYRELEKGYTDLLQGASPGATFSVFRMRYWGEFDKVGPLEPSVSSLWGIRAFAGPTGFLFLPKYVRDAYYKDGIIVPPGNDFWRIAYPEMVSADAKILARYGIRILLVPRDNLDEFIISASKAKVADLYNITDEQIKSERVAWDVEVEKHRYYVLVIDDGYIDGYFYSVAELSFFKDGHAIPPSNIRVFSDTALGDHIVDNLLDNNRFTFWHVSMDSINKRHFLLFDFGHEIKISRIAALKRESFNDQFWKHARFFGIPEQYITIRGKDGKAVFNKNIVPLKEGWSSPPDFIRNHNGYVPPYMLFLNQKYVGRAYVQNDDSSLRGLPILIDTAEHISIDVRGVPKGSRVVLADNYFEGWQVTVDGILVKPDISSHFRSVTLPKEASIVEWRYSSKYIGIGIVVSLSAIMIAVLGAVTVNKKEKVF